MYLAWVSVTFFGVRLISGRNVNSADLMYVLSAVTLIAVFSGCWLFHKRADNILYKENTLWIAPLGMTLCTLLLIVDPQSAIGGVAVVISGIGTGVFSAVCLMHWGRLCSMLDMREIVVTGAVSFALSALVDLLLQGLFATALSLASNSTAPIVVADTLLAFGSGFVLRWYVHREGLPLDRHLPSSESVQGGSTAQADKATSIVSSVAIALVVFGFSSNVTRELSFSMMGGAEGIDKTIHLAILAGVFALICVVNTLFACQFFSHRGSKITLLFYRAIVLLLIASCCISMPLTSHYGEQFIVTNIVSGASLQCCYFLMWITTIGICHIHRQHSTEFFALMRLAWALGPTLGSIAAFIVRSLPDPIPAFDSVLIVSIIGTFIVYSTTLPESKLAEALAILPKEHRRPFAERCGLVAERYALTERELEVMTLFAKGRDSAFIQKNLNLSKSTVSTHRQHIYGKLGVHSHQEMLDVIYSTDVSNK